MNRPYAIAADVPESALAPPPPRVPSKRARWIVFAYEPIHAAMRLVGLVSVGMGLFVYCIFGRSIAADFALDVVASKTSGVVVSQTVDRSTSVDSVHPTSFVFRYESNGRTFDGQSSALVIPPPLLHSRKVDVEYLVFAPRYARIAGTTLNSGGDAIGGLIALMLSFGAGAVGGAWWLMRRKRRAFIYGVPARGCIAFVGNSSVAINGVHPKKMAWTFVDDRGNERTGGLMRMDASAMSAFEANAEVVVLYDRRDPTANTLYLE